MVLCSEDEMAKGPIWVLREDGTCGVYGVNLECMGEVQDKIRTVLIPKLMYQGTNRLFII